jgi:hypothetical protein
VLVLRGRELRDDANLVDTTRFDDDVWELGPASHQVHRRGYRLNFVRVPQRFRLAAKELFYELLSGDPPAGESRWAISTVRRELLPVRKFLSWAQQHGHPTLGSMTRQDLTDYQLWLLTTDLGQEERVKHRRAARLFWTYRDNLHSDRLTFDPQRLHAWATDSSPTGRHGENKTDRIPEQVISPLLGWALRWIDDFSCDIIAARTEWWQLHQKHWKLRGSTNPLPAQPALAPTAKPLAALLNELLNRYRITGQPLPGNGDGSVNQTFLARQLGRPIDDLRRPPIQAQISAAAAELGVAGAPYLFTPVRALLDGKPWLPAFRFGDINELVRMLQAACYVVIAYLSGMRDCEKRAELRLMQHSAAATTG